MPGRLLPSTTCIWIGPIQHDDNLIHSKVPIRSFEDFKGKKIRYPGGIIADIYRSAGVATVLLPGGEVYPALEKGVIDGADFVGAAINYNLGYGEIAKYIIMGPPSTPCLHQPVDLMSVEVNMNSWKKIPPHLQMLFEAAVSKHSYDQYTAIQAADIVAFEKFQKEQGVEVIRLKDSDIEKFKKFAPALWVKWAKKSPAGHEGLQVPARIHGVGQSGLLYGQGHGRSRRERNWSFKRMFRVREG